MWSEGESNPNWTRLSWSELAKQKKKPNSNNITHQNTHTVEPIYFIKPFGTIDVALSGQ